VDFVGRLTPLSSCYTFALAVNAGQVAATLLQLQKLLAAKGIALGAGFDLKMPSNYIPWGGAQPREEQETLFAKAEQKIDRVAEFVRRCETGWVERGPWWQNVFFSAINKLSFSRVPKMDKDFWVDEKCNGCGLCAKVCPSANILLDGGRPFWQGHCEQCLACLQWCPQEAVQYAKRTAEKKRYHHPDVSAADMKAANWRQ
jgi:ferredoxin